MWLKALVNYTTNKLLAQPFLNNILNFFAKSNMYSSDKKKVKYVFLYSISYI